MFKYLRKTEKQSPTREGGLLLDPGPGAALNGSASVARASWSHWFRDACYTALVLTTKLSGVAMPFYIPVSSAHKGSLHFLKFLACQLQITPLPLEYLEYNFQKASRFSIELDCSIFSTVIHDI